MNILEVILLVGCLTEISLFALWYTLRKMGVL